MIAKNRVLLLLSVCTPICFLMPSLVFKLLQFEIVYNQSSSLKGSVYLVKKSPIHEVQEGDIILFSHKKYDLPLLKRVSHIEHKKYQPMIGYNCDFKHDINKSLVVPKGHVAVLGDHVRSYDSRYQSFGFVSHQQIRGKAWQIF